jgi:hypothetical protein
LHFREDTGTRDIVLTLLSDKVRKVREMAVDAAYERTEVAHEIQLPLFDALMSVSARYWCRASRYFRVAEVSATVLSAFLAQARMEERSRGTGMCVAGARRGESSRRL